MSQEQQNTRTHTHTSQQLFCSFFPGSFVQQHCREGYLSLLEHKAVQHVGGGGFSVVGGGYSQRHIHAAAWLKETEAEPGKGEVAFSSKTN